MKQDDPPKPRPEKKPRRCRRWLVRGLLALIVLLVGAELYCRFWLGLGDPPLSVADPEIEYLFKPSATYHRFGNRIHYNAWSMRSDDFPKHKTDPRELRVLMVGDSVVNGTALTDEKDLATTLLRQRLAAKLNRPVIVGNISAGSWGPPNQLAYLKRFGFFDADVVVFVFNHGDAIDLPTFQPVVGVLPGFPDRKPLTALQEAIFRYAPNFLPAWLGGRAPAAEAPENASPERGFEPECLDAFGAMVAMARSAGAKTIMAQHRAQAETQANPDPGTLAFRHKAEELGVVAVDMGPQFRAAQARGDNPYRDPIHPNVLGQRLIADALEEPILEAVASRTPATRPQESSVAAPRTP